MTTPRDPQSLVFTPEEVDALKTIALQYLNAGNLPQRLEFDRSDVQIKTVRLNRRMIEDATKLEPNFNKLVELLVWRFLGESREYLAKGPKSE
jgi:hypothetical protein